MSPSPRNYLKQAQLYRDETEYAFLQLPINAITVAAGVIAEWGEPFSALIIDKDEITLIIAEEAIEHFQKRLITAVISETRYHLITLDVILPPDLSGFMAFISSALADSGIVIMPFAAYNRDHILVPVNQSDAALQILEELKATH